MSYRTMVFPVVLAVMLAAPSVSQAQSRGTWDLTLLADPAEGSFNPLVGYFILDNTELAFTGGYSSSRFGGDFGGDIKTLALEMDILYNAYIMENLAFVPLAGAGILKTSDSFGSSNSHEDVVYYNVGGGFRYFTNKTGALTIFVFHRYSEIDSEDGEIACPFGCNPNSDGTSIDISVRIGYSLFFP